MPALASVSSLLQVEAHRPTVAPAQLQLKAFGCLTAEAAASHGAVLLPSSTADTVCLGWGLGKPQAAGALLMDLWFSTLAQNIISVAYTVSPQWQSKRRFHKVAFKPH